MTRKSAPKAETVDVIAATALHHGLTVVSRDVGDFEKARVPVFNPWSDRR